MPVRLRTPLLVVAVMAASILGTLGTLRVLDGEPLTGSGAAHERSAAARTCPKPGFSASRSAVERYEDCRTAGTVRAWLLDAGATDAEVVVQRVETGSLVGPGSVTEVTAKVTLGSGPWSTEEARDTVARLARTTPDRVALVDEHLRDLETP